MTSDLVRRIESELPEGKSVEEALKIYNHATLVFQDEHPEWKTMRKNDPRYMELLLGLDDYAWDKVTNYFQS